MFRCHDGSLYAQGARIPEISVRCQCIILLTDTRNDPHPRKYFIKTAKKHAELSLQVTDRQTGALQSVTEPIVMAVAAYWGRTPA